MARVIRTTLVAAAMLLAVAQFAASALAQLPNEKNPARKARQAAAEIKPATPQLMKKDLEAFLDGFVPVQLQQDDIAGAVVCVVKDGEVIFAKGYGYSDVKTRKPVTVDATLFRPGSISKTFTWTAVMQLVEQGKIELNRDVNDYIDFKIPAAFGKSITMKDLMTHTPGFQEALKDLFVPNASDINPLAVYLPSHLPREIFPPGTTPAYSNYGATLAGYIVQRVSGMPFDDYVEKNIFQPLRMSHTTFRQPLPDNLKAMMSNGYAKASGDPKSFEFVQAWPAGSVSTTAEDMSHWMIAHLQDGQYDGVRILKPETARLMHSRAWTNVTALNGGAYGFYEESRNGRHIIGHGGDTGWFHSDMHLMLDDHVGFFVSVNSAGKGDTSVLDALWGHLLDRYFPYTPPAGVKVVDTKRDIQAVVGTYWSSRRERATPNQTKVIANSDGTISVEDFKDFAGNPKHFEEIDPMMFREVHGQDQLAFKTDANGETLSTDFPFEVFQRVPALKNGKANEIVLGCALGVFVLTVLFWPTSAMIRRHYNQRLALSARYLRVRMMVRAACFINLLAVGLFVAWISSLQNNIAAFSEHSDGRLHAMQVVGLIGLIASLVSIYYCIYSWATNSLWIWTRIWNTLLTLACLGYVFLLLNWHMLNFHLTY
jgi:CubicO group peptidase (beta-lactamase class C family)